MIRIVSSVFAATLLTLSLGGGAAQALSRVFVAAQGSDGNPCTFALPCRTFQHAHDTVAVGGEIAVLDSAGYGALTISKSITITNPGGVEAGITPPAGQTAITINVAASSNITLRGLTIDGVGVGGTGINVMSNMVQGASGTLRIIGCVVKGFTGNGISVHPGFSAIGAIPLEHILIADSFFLDNGGNGIDANPSGLNMDFAIYRTVTSGNTTGVNLSTTSGASIASIFVSGHADDNRTFGIALASSVAWIMKSSTARFNGIDVNNSTSFLVLKGENEIGILANSGTGFSDGTNNIASISGSALIVEPRQ